MIYRKEVVVKILTACQDLSREEIRHVIERLSSWHPAAQPTPDAGKEE